MRRDGVSGGVTVVRNGEHIGDRFTDGGTGFDIGWGQPDQGQYDQARPVGAIAGAALLARHAVFDELGGFDGTYGAYLEDVDLCWRAWLRGYTVEYVPAALAYHHYGASGGGRASEDDPRLLRGAPSRSVFVVPLPVVRIVAFDLPMGGRCSFFRSRASKK